MLTMCGLLISVTDQSDVRVGHLCERIVNNRWKYVNFRSFLSAQSLSAQSTCITKIVLFYHYFQAEFFGDEIPVAHGEDGILFVKYSDGKFTGDTFVLFPSEEVG